MTCCLLQLCCPPLQRREKTIAHYESMGFDRTQSERLADDTITRFDELLSTPFGALLKEAVKHGKDKA